MNTVSISASVSVNVGKIRGNNEDNFYLNGISLDQSNRDVANTYTDTSSQGTSVFGVFDGMGGEAFGEEASLIASNVLRGYHQKLEKSNKLTCDNMVKMAVKEANITICNKILQSGEKRIGTTFAALTIENDVAKVYNIGDSRIYRYRNGELVQLSRDDTAAQRLLNMGMISKEEADKSKEKHRLTQHLGIFPDEMSLEIHSHEIEDLKKGDVFLLCSDGLTDMVTEHEIEKVISTGADSKGLSKALVDLALNNGGEDNVTALVVCIDSTVKQKPKKKHKIWLVVLPIIVLTLLAVVWVGTKEVKNVEKSIEKTPERVYFSGINAEKIRIHIGDSDYFMCGSVPAEIDKRNVKYSSADEDIISIDEYGKYTAVGAGKTFVELELNGCKAKLKVEVFNEKE